MSTSEERQLLDSALSKIRIDFQKWQQGDDRKVPILENHVEKISQMRDSLEEANRVNGGNAPGDMFDHWDFVQAAEKILKPFTERNREVERSHERERDSVEAHRASNRARPRVRTHASTVATVVEPVEQGPLKEEFTGLKPVMDALNTLTDGRAANDSDALRALGSFLESNGVENGMGEIADNQFLQSGASYELVQKTTREINSAITDGNLSEQDLQEIASTISNHIDPNSIVINTDGIDDAGFNAGLQAQARQSLKNTGRALR